MRSIAARFLLPFGFLTILISLFVFYRTYDASRKHAHELISQQAAMALEFNLAIREYVGKKIRPFVETYVDKDVFIPEVMSTSYVSRAIFEEVRLKFPHYIVRFSSENPRNPSNIANADEIRMIEYFRQNPNVGPVTDEIQIDGKRYLAHFTPKWMKPECMQCHDDPQNAPAGLIERYGATASFHKKVGDVAGLDTVAVPVESIDDILAVEVRSRSLILALGIALLFGAIIVVFRYVVARRLAVIAGHFNEIAANAESPSMTPVNIRGNDEIGMLGAAFNKLVEQLRETHASLEARVARRTDELRSVNTRLEAELTERKMAEEALRQSEESFRRITENMHDLVCHTDSRCLYQYVSPSFRRVLGYDPGELLGESVFARIHPDDRTRVEAECERFIRSGEDREIEFRYKHADGHYMWFVTAGSLLYDAAGAFSGLIFNSRDITTRKCAQDLLRQSEEKFSQVFQTTSLAIVILSGDATLVDVNPGFVAATGYTREEAIGRSLDELNLREGPPGKGLPLTTSGLDGEVCNREITFRRKDGTLGIGMCSIQELVLDGQECMLLVMQDITDNKTAAAEKEQLQAQLIQAQRMESIGRLAGGVAHDFNNMLSVILGRAQLSLDQLDPGQPLCRNILEIKKAAERSADLTRQLLAFARRQTVNPVTVDLNDTISGMLSIFQRLVGEDIHLDWVPGDKLWKIKIDPSQIDQILANLIVNGRDAILGVGSIILKTENVVVEHSILPEHPEFLPGEYVLLTVSDTGMGMNAEVLDHLFEPFFTTKEIGKGTGLGLATVYGIVKQNNGFIYVDSVLGRGAAFKIYIPRVDAEVASSRVKETARLKMGTETTVLLVEDDEAVLNLGKMILEIEGYNVLAARLPREAIRLSEGNGGEIHLLITDVVMPEMNGRELVERLSASRPGLRCLYMSGYTADVIAHRGILDEGINFIQKPFTRDDFTRKISKILNNGQALTVDVSSSSVELAVRH